MARKGNAANAKLNGEFASHVSGLEKRQTAKIRRQDGKRIVRSEAATV